MANSMESLESQIKDLKAQVSALKNREYQLELVIEGASVGIWDWYVQSGEASFNERWSNIIGYTLEELRPVSIETWMKYAHPDDLKESDRLLKEHWAGTTEYYTFESRMRHKDGHWIWVYATGKVIEWESDGVAKRMIGTHLDITEKKESAIQVATEARELWESEQRLQAVINNTVDGIITIDSRGVINSFNLAAENMFGYKARETIGNNVQMLMDSFHSAKHDGYLANHIATGENKIIGLGRELEGKRKDNSLFPMELAISKFQMDGDFVFTGIVRDITRRKNLEAQLLQSQKMEALGTLAGGIAHDFNNILSIVIGNAELVKKSYVDIGSNQSNIDNIVSASERAVKLVQQIMTVSRMSTTRVVVMNLRTALLSTIELISATCPANIVFAQDFAGFDKCRINADEAQIQQIIMNLCTNAIFAMKNEGGSINFGLREVTGELSKVLSNESTYIELSVRDEGSGIASENIEKIFNPFFTTKTIGEGTGLGLSVVHSIVREHHGDIRVESEKGKGACFYLYFPTVAEAEHSIAIVEEASSYSNRTGNVLIVDDEPALAELYRTFLEAVGYNVTACSGGEEAVRIFQDDIDKFDLVLTDYSMPNMTGEQLAEKLLKMKVDIPIILATGYGELLSIEGVGGLGIKDCLVKPIKLDKLHKVIIEHIRK